MEADQTDTQGGGEGSQHRKKAPPPTSLWVSFPLLILLHEFLHSIFHFTLKTLSYYVSSCWKSQHFGRTRWPHPAMPHPKKE